MPILLQIQFAGGKGLFEMSAGYSAYADEDEILIQDGLEYRVLKNKQELC